MANRGPACPLCSSRSPAPFYEEGSRAYFACARCDLRFLDPSARLRPHEEKARYLQHDNDVDDPRYREFVRPLHQQVRQHVRPGASGLDFGAGTGPVLAAMLRADGYDVRSFDPFFHPDPASLRQAYDFIVACEVAEHFFRPSFEFERLRSILRDGGLLGLMTVLWEDGTDFANWHYRRDPTHVAFYTRATFHRVAVLFGFAEVSFPANRVVLLHA